MNTWWVCETLTENIRCRLRVDLTLYTFLLCGLLCMYVNTHTQQSSSDMSDVKTADANKGDSSSDRTFPHLPVWPLHSVCMWPFTVTHRFVSDQSGQFPHAALSSPTQWMSWWQRSPRSVNRIRTVKLICRMSRSVSERRWAVCEEKS